MGRTERHAVLIGVDYQGCQSALSSQGCPPGLEAAVNDVEALQRLLIDCYQCRPGHITVLVHQNATEPKILTTLTALRQTTTAALMEGLSGKADDTKTGRITVTTLDLYLAERVKDLTQRQQKSVTVKPAAVGDFPLALVQ